jgi:recombination protein RecT
MSKTAIAPIETVCRVIGSEPMQLKIQQALPSGISLDRFTRTTLTAIQTKPEIVEAEHNSLYNSVVRAAADGLMPDGRQGAIVVYDTKVKLTNGQERWIKKAQWMVMVEGCIHKLTKAGVMAYAVSVYANDDFELWNDEVGQHVRHRPPPRFGKRGDRVGAFALGRVLATNAVYVEPMDMEELKRVMRKSKGASLDKDGNATKGPWREWPERMEQKSCLHRLDKRIGTSALTDEEYDDGKEDQAQLPVAPVVLSDGPTPVHGESAGAKRPRALQKVIDQAEDTAGSQDQLAGAVPEAAGSGDSPVKNQTPETSTGVTPGAGKPAAPENEIEQTGDELF